MATVTFTSSGTWTSVATLVDCQCWGSGGNGGNGQTGVNTFSGGGGGGGGYGEETNLVVTPTSNYSFTVGTGGGSSDTTFPGDAATVTAHHGANGFNTTRGNGGAVSSNSITHSGGNGGSGNTNSNPAGAGGGGSAGAGGNGGAGTSGSFNTAGAAGGSAGAGSPGGAAGGQGGSGAATGIPGFPGVAPGGGGGGASGRTGGTTGGAGAAGQITLIYTSSIPGTATLPAVSSLNAAWQILSPTGAPGQAKPGATWLRKFGFGRKHQLLPGYQIQTLQGTATLPAAATVSAFGSAPNPAVVNVWANNYGQGTSFTTITSALQSCVVPLNAGSSIGHGSGTPTAGNWLFTIASWTQDPQIINVHTGVSDDIHSWWRQFPAAGPGGNVRTAISYTPNLARVPGNVYVAPDMEIAAINVIVVEVQGLGAWDTVTGTNVNYAASATSLNLALGAPPQATFWIAGAGGDNSSAGQAFAPAGWGTITQQVQSNGSNNLADNVLNVAYQVNSSSSQSVTATASTAENLSGFLIGVELSAAVPIPANQNPNWPYTVLEAAFGAGFNTPNSEIGPDGSTTQPLTWTDLSSRLWDYDETTGIQFQLGEIQATNLNLELDNVDGALSPLNAGSPYYSNSMLSNSTFQASVSPWTATGSATLTQSAAQTYASANGAIAGYSLQVTPNGVTANPGAASEQVAVSGTWSYTASAWFYSAAGYATGAQLLITWYTSSHTSISTSSGTATAIPAATWTQLTFTATSPSNAAYGQVTVRFSGTLSATPFWVAEAAVVPGTAAVMTGLVAAGTPLRLRSALGTLGGSTVNRWYVIQRNAGEWTEVIDSMFRRFVQVTGTDLWSALSAVPPTFYRSEVLEDNPYAWWPMDDQPESFGILPVTLLNAAVGNPYVLDIQVSPNGAQFQQIYNKVGAAAGGLNGGSWATGIGGASIPPGIAIYSVGVNAGWMFGDPQGTTPTLDTGNPTTATPGSAAWAALGQAGATGKYGWYLSCNDTNFPPLANGVTAEIWFNYQFYASGNGFETSVTGSGNFGPALQQPYNTPFTIWEMATDSNPVAVLQLDASGHLNFITYNGGTGTSHSIYTASDLRSSSWHMATVTMTQTGWTVWLDGGANANVTGTATGMTSAWTWMLVNCDFGSGGGTNSSGFTHCGNAAFAHLAVYPVILPYYRIMDHYWAAVTAFGQLPAPTAPTASWSSNPVTKDAVTTGAYAPDGTDSGSYETSDGVAISGRVAAIAPGGITSGASAWTTGSTEAVTISTGYGIGFATPWIGWTGVSPQFAVYMAGAPGAEKEASISSGSGESFTSGYGGSANPGGVANVSDGDGSSPPSVPTAIGDTVGERIERLLRGGRCTSPQRSIDPAPLLVHAPGTQGGGIQAGASVQEIQQSDSGFLFVDNTGNLVYWQRPHLASQYGSPVWQMGPSGGRIPYYRDAGWVSDPQRIWNAITISPFSPSGAQLPLVVPQDYTAVQASQDRFGAQPLQIISWLQDGSTQLDQANWLFQWFGVPERRAEKLRVDAAPYPAAWELVMGINVGHIVQVEDWQIGGGGTVYTYRVTEIKRRISMPTTTSEMTGSVEIIVDFEPPEYF